MKKYIVQNTKMKVLFKIKEAVRSFVALCDPGIVVYDTWLY